MTPAETAAPRPRLLWVTDEEPNRTGGGGAIRQAHLVIGLSKHFDVHVLTTGHVHDDGVRDAIAGLVEIPRPARRVPRSNIERRLHEVTNIAFGSQPSDFRVSARSRRVLSARLAELAPQFDVVVVVNLNMAAVLPRRRRAFAVLDLHHLPSTMLEHRVATTTGRRQRWLFATEATKAARFETKQLAAYDLALACSAEDAVTLRDRGARQVIVTPNGVSVESFPATPIPHAPRLLFPATLDFGPNSDAARWFCDEVLPRVHRDVPDAVLDIVGRRPSAEVLALAERPGVTIHADVPSIVPYFERARVVLVPVRMGSGTRLKALEAMAAARPVVGTSIGLAGLDLVDGQHALFADDGEAMAAAVVQLLRDEHLARRLADAGRRLVEGSYDWSAIGTACADQTLSAFRRFRQVAPKAGAA